MDFKNDYAELRGSEATKQSVDLEERNGVEALRSFFIFPEKK